MKRVLFLGLSPPREEAGVTMVHCPIITTVPRELDTPVAAESFSLWPSYTHVVITSKTSVPLLIAALFSYGYSMATVANKIFMAVGTATAGALAAAGISAAYIPTEETAEGIVSLLQDLVLEEAFFFLPRSAQGRSVIPDYLQCRGVRYVSCPLYDTLPSCPPFLPRLEDFDEIVFSSPSCVDAFIEFFGPLPQNKCLTSIGPVTAKRIRDRILK